MIPGQRKVPDEPDVVFGALSFKDLWRLGGISWDLHPKPCWQGNGGDVFSQPFESCSLCFSSLGEKSGYCRSTINLSRCPLGPSVISGSVQRTFLALPKDIWKWKTPGEKLQKRGFPLADYLQNHPFPLNYSWIQSYAAWSRIPALPMKIVPHKPLRKYGNVPEAFGYWFPWLGNAFRFEELF